MRAFNWLKRLTRCESGNVIMIGAATLPMVMGAAGLAVDTVQLAMWKRQIQRAADSAALAGAHALAQGASTNQAVANDLSEHVTLDANKNEKPPVSSTTITPGSFAAGTISSQTCTARGVAPCFDQAVRVQLVSERRLPFVNLFTRANNVIQAEGTAAVTSTGQFCMISLFNGNSPGIIAGGNPNLNLSCGIATNARAATNAINIFGNATVLATPLAAVGGIAPGRNTYSAQVMQPYSAAVDDPYADVPNPTAPSGCDSPLQVGNREVVDIPAGSCFTSWDIDGHARLASNSTYYVNNGHLDIKGQVSGTNVTIVLVGDNSTMTQNGGGQLNITAPGEASTSPYKGIALYRSRTAANPNNAVKINGGAELQVTGAVYMPSTDIWIGGNANFSATCLQVIGRVLDFKGGGSITNSCANTGTRTIRQPIVRLVG
jgi:Flp pilus assembly protein TadG